MCAPSEDLDQPGHPPSLIRVYAVCMKKPLVLSYPLSAQRRTSSDWADAQADLSLRWARTHFVGFVVSWLIFLFLMMQPRSKAGLQVWQQLVQVGDGCNSGWQSQAEEFPACTHRQGSLVAAGGSWVVGTQLHTKRLQPEFSLGFWKLEFKNPLLWKVGSTNWKVGVCPKNLGV